MTTASSICHLLDFLLMRSPLTLTRALQGIFYCLHFLVEKMEAKPGKDTCRLSGALRWLLPKMPWLRDCQLQWEAQWREQKSKAVHLLTVSSFNTHLLSIYYAPGPGIVLRIHWWTRQVWSLPHGGVHSSVGKVMRKWRTKNSGSDGCHWETLGCKVGGDTVGLVRKTKKANFFPLFSTWPWIWPFSAHSALINWIHKFPKLSQARRMSHAKAQTWVYSWLGWRTNDNSGPRCNISPGSREHSEDTAAGHFPEAAQQNV